MYSNNVTEINELLLLNNYKLLKSISHGFGNFSDLIYGFELIKNEVGVVIPAYNEEESIEKTINELYFTLKKEKKFLMKF